MDPSSPPKQPQSETAIFIQDACYQHRFIRSRDTSSIVERPERLRAVKIGLSAALARLQELLSPEKHHATDTSRTGSDPDDLAAALGKLKIEPTDTVSSKVMPPGIPVAIKHSAASVAILNNEAVKFVHGDIEGDVYLMKLKKWIEESVDKIATDGSEIPEGYSQGDLYLCPESLNAIQGALGTVCEAVDTVVNKDPGPSSEIRRAFVAIRPPGHHCGEDTPSGFCFVNNVAVAAAHAHLKHGVNRIVILDIDLHHGNGTQSIVWQINEESYRQALEAEAGASTTKPGLKVYYGSLHDILSYPCEDGKPELIQAASVSIHGAHGQHIENVHLETYESEDHFWDELYEKKYVRILKKAEDFLEGSGGPGDDVLVFISCGMDACEHEYPSMSRHNRKVPTGFYHRFTRDVCLFAEKYARGRVVSVLEGGYSDRALMSGTLAHFCGMVELDLLGDGEGEGEERKLKSGRVEEEWWSVDNLGKLEKTMKKRRGGKVSASSNSIANELWLERTQAIFSALEPNTIPSSSSTRSIGRGVPLGPSSMTLRERKKPIPSTSPGVSPKAKPPRSGGGGGRSVSGRVGGTGGKWKTVSELVSAASVQGRKEGSGVDDGQGSDTSSTLSSVPDDDNDDDDDREERKREPAGLGTGAGAGAESVSKARKLPRVILKLGPSPGEGFGV